MPSNLRVLVSGGLLVLGACGGSEPEADSAGDVSVAEAVTTIGELAVPRTLSPVVLPSGPLAENLREVDCPTLADVVGETLPTLADEEVIPRCFVDVYRQPDGSLIPANVDQPQTGVVLYADVSLDPYRLSAQELLDAGSVFIAGGAQLIGSVPPDLSAIERSESVAISRDADPQTIVRRISDRRVVSTWWGFGSQRRSIEWNLFTAGTPDEALTLARSGQQSAATASED